MTKKLKISPDLSLPLDFVTSTQAILAKKGKGKTYKASVEAEELLEANQQIVAIDPTGAWWGLRSSADGKSAGYPIIIFGGEHADVELLPTAGEVVADAIAAEHFSAIIDLTLFRKGESLRFMAAFLETLYRKNRNALHLFIDEADVVAPQKTFGPDEARVLGACEDIVRRGRIRGIGCTLITQRPQVLNKNVLSQVDMLTALGMNHPKDIGAIKDWVAVHGDEAQAKQMIADLPALPQGEAWIWAPAADIFKRVTFRDRHTFDSGRTPKAGETRSAPKVIAPVDIERLGKTIASTVEQQKANDPKALKARVVELEKELGARPGAKVETKTVEKPVIKAGQLTHIEKLIGRGDKLADRIASAGDKLAALGQEFTNLRAELGQDLNQLRAVAGIARQPEIVLPKAPPVSKPARANSPPKPVILPDGEALSSSKQRILNALASLEAIGVVQADKTQLALFAEQSPKSSGYTNNLGALRTAGLIDYPSGGVVALTDAGRELADASGAPTTTAEMHAYVQNLIGSSRWNVLSPLIDAYPKAIAKDRLAELAAVSSASSGYTNNLGAMRSLGLLDYPRPGEVRAADLLFLEAR